MARALFEKKGRAIWISHLDLMRLFQRAFKRAGLQLKHTQGYNPRPSVSIALPLSVGIDSGCELLDFDLEGEIPSNDEIMEQLNAALVEGVRVLAVYNEGRKLRDIAFLSCNVDLAYDYGIPTGTTKKIRTLFSAASLFVAKKSKNGPVEQDIIPMVKQISVAERNACSVRISAVICCQNPSMNPIQLAQAVEHYLPEYAPNHYTCSRIEIMDRNFEIFR